MDSYGRTEPTGELSLRQVRDLGDLRVQPVSRRWRVRNFLQYRRRSVGQLAAAKVAGRVFGLITAYGELSGRVYRPDFSRLHAEQLFKLKELLAANVDVRELTRYFGGHVLDYGTLSTRKVTNNGVAFIVDAFQNTVELENMKFHGFGTGTTAEATGDAALVTELTTQYATDNTRPTGTTEEGASANIYKTVATLSPDSGGTIAVTEHGVFSANSAGVLLDRSVFSAVNIVAAQDSLQATYQLTIAAEA